MMFNRSSALPRTCSRSFGSLWLPRICYFNERNRRCFELWQPCSFCWLRNMWTLPQVFPPSRACFAHEKVPFFPKAIIFLYGDTTKCDDLQRNATQFGRNWPFWCVLPPKWIFLKKRPCGWLPLNHLGFIDYYTNKTQDWLSTWAITYNYIPLTMLRAAGLKRFKVN